MRSVILIQLASAGTGKVWICEGLAKGERLWHDKPMPKPKAKKKKLPAKNTSDPIKLARSVVEAAIGEPLTSNPKRTKKKGRP